MIVRGEPQATATGITYAENFVNFGNVFEAGLCERTDGQTDRHRDMLK